MKFGISVSHIRHGLLEKGFYLKGSGDQFIIPLPKENSDYILKFGRIAMHALERGVILGTNTPMDTLTPSERRRHESICERIAIKSVLMRRSASIHKFVSKTQPKLVEEKKNVEPPEII